MLPFLKILYLTVIGFAELFSVCPCGCSCSEKQITAILENGFLCYKSISVVSRNYSEWNVVILYSNVLDAPESPVELQEEGHISESAKY